MFKTSQFQFYGHIPGVKKRQKTHYMTKALKSGKNTKKNTKIYQYYLPL